MLVEHHQVGVVMMKVKVYLSPTYAEGHAGVLIGLINSMMRGCDGLCMLDV